MIRRARRPAGGSRAEVRVLFARYALAQPGEWIAGGGVVVRRGSIVRVLRTAGEVRRARRDAAVASQDLGDVVLAPGFVDAHVHLDLGALRAPGHRMPRRGSFPSWIRALLRERAALERADLVRGAAHAIARLLATGTTTVGDIDSTGAAAQALARSPLRARVYREILDAADPARTDAAARRMRAPVPTRGAARARTHPGLSPHAPYTVSPELLRRVAVESARRRRLVCVHWAETREEVAWLAEARGPMRRLLEHSPRRPGLDLIADAGLLGPRLLLVHGNHPAPGDLERIARAGAKLAVCPGAHAWFGREPFDLRACLAAGVEVVLGTDSLASNDDLDMRRELALLRRAHPWLAPDRAWDMATRASAGALGFSGRAGILAPGAWADLAAHSLEGLSSREWRDPGARIEALTTGCDSVAGVWIAGQRVEEPAVA